MNSILTWQEDWRQTTVCPYLCRNLTAEILSWTPQSSSNSSSRTSPWQSCNPTQTRRATTCSGPFVDLHVNMVKCCFFFLLTWVYAEFVLDLYFSLVKSIFLRIKLIEGNTQKVYNNYFPPGACVLTPSSSSLMRTQTGNWALMSFSTA